MGVTNVEILREIKDMRTDVHALDKKLAVHVSECAVTRKRSVINAEALNGNGSQGIKQQTRVLWEEHLTVAEEHTEASSDRRKYVFDLKSAIVVLILTGVSQVVVHMVTQ